MTWYMEGAEEAPNSAVLNVAMHNRKSNLGGKISAPIGFTLTFAEDRTSVRSSNPADNPDLAAKAPLWQRMQSLLSRGPKTAEEIAAELDSKVKIVQAEYSRRKSLFVVINNRVGLATADTEPGV